MDVTIVDEGSPSTHELFLPDGPPEEMVIFKSSDNIIFHVRRRYLEANTGGFPGPELRTYGEMVDLSETSEVLAILFQFIPPSRHPLLEDVQFPLLGEIAEAAEKYQVFPAMGVAVHRMRFIISKNELRFPLVNPAFPILNHAVKHGYTTLINEAALNIACSKLSGIAKRISPNVAPAWLKYHAEWESVFENAALLLRMMRSSGLSCDKDRYDPEDGTPDPAICDRCFCLLSAWLLELSNYNRSVIHLRAAIKERRMTISGKVEVILCEACKDRCHPECMHAYELRSQLLRFIDNVPLFTTFL